MHESDVVSWQQVRKPNMRALVKISAETKLARRARKAERLALWIMAAYRFLVPPLLIGKIAFVFLWMSLHQTDRMMENLLTIPMYLGVWVMVGRWDISGLYRRPALAGDERSAICPPGTALVPMDQTQLLAAAGVEKWAVGANSFRRRLFQAVVIQMLVLGGVVLCKAWTGVEPHWAWLTPISLLWIWLTYHAWNQPAFPKSHVYALRGRWSGSLESLIDGCAQDRDLDHPLDPVLATMCAQASRESICQLSYLRRLSLNLIALRMSARSLDAGWPVVRASLIASYSRPNWFDRRRFQGLRKRYRDTEYAAEIESLIGSFKQGGVAPQIAESQEALPQGSE